MERKWQIPFLEQARLALLVDHDLQQNQAAYAFQVDERELRDYIKFKHNQNPEISPQAQNAINLAYRDYCDTHAAKAFHSHLEWWGKWYGLNPRAVRELWEVCPDYYPSLYVRVTV